MSILSHQQYDESCQAINATELSILNPIRGLSIINPLWPTFPTIL